MEKDLSKPRYEIAENSKLESLSIPEVFDTSAPNQSILETVITRERKEAAIKNQLSEIRQKKHQIFLDNQKQVSKKIN